MPLPIPTNNPRIVGAISPGDGQMSVNVRMPVQLASKYPDKAWGTAIDTIGLAKKDSDLYVGYTLVDIQPMRDSDDLLWVFEKLSSPIWTTTSLGSESNIPEKLRGQVSLTKTLQEVVPGTAPDALTGDLMSSVVEDKQNTGKAVKVNTSETIDVNATALVSPSLEDQLYVTTEILVAEGTVPDTGTGVVESVVQAIGKGKAIKTTKFACTAYTNKTTYTVGYATLINENEGSADSIPAKFRALMSLKTWRFRVQAATPPATPALGTGTGAYAGFDIVERAIKQTQENGSTDVFEMVIVGLANTGANALNTTTYGKIVTTTATETLAAVGQTIDTGLHIIASTVEELGNGLSIKNTEQVQGGEWPDPVEEEISSDGTRQPPARYLRDLTRRTVSKKIGTIPGSVSLAGDEVARAYKRETPDRVDEKITTEELSLTLTAVDTDVNQKPFVKITSVMTPGETKVIPTNRNGSAKLVYEKGAQQIWENTEEIAEAREGVKGTDVNAQQWGAIQSTTTWTTNGTAPAGGSIQVIFADGTLTVYEATETSVSVLGESTDIDSQPWGQTRWDGLYQTSPDGARSRQVWSNGVTRVFLNETPTLTISGTTKEQDNNPWGVTVWDGTYSGTPGGDKYRQITSINGQPVYLNETATITLGGTTKEIDPSAWGSTTWNGTFAETSSGTRSRKVTQIGDTSVYLNEEPTISIVEEPFVSGIENNPIFQATDTTHYANAPSVTGDNARSRLVYALGAERVFENIDTSIVGTGTRTYGTVVRFEVPSVLVSLNINEVFRRRGGKDWLFNPVVEEGFKGYVPAEVVEYFSTDPGVTLPDIISFGPTPVHLSTPWGSVSVGPTLHPQIVIQMILDGDPTYFDDIGQILIAPTNYTHWRGAGRILVAYETSPYKNGFVTREVYVTL